MGAALKAIEHRATRRLPIRVEIQYSTMEDFLLDYTANVSLGGVFIRTESPLAVGTRFRLRLQVPHRRRPLDTLGEVRWTQEPDGELMAGMGVRFDGMSAADERAVARMLAAWEAGEEEAVDSPLSNVLELPR